MVDNATRTWFAAALVGASAFSCCPVRSRPTVSGVVDDFRAQGASAPVDVRQPILPSWARVLGIWGQPRLPPGSTPAVFLPGARMASLGRTGQVSIWHLPSQAMVALYPPCHPLSGKAPGPWRLPEIAGALAVDPSGQRLAIGDHLGRVCVRAVSDGTVLRDFQAHPWPVWFLMYRNPAELLTYGYRPQQGPPVSSVPAPSWSVHANVQSDDRTQAGGDLALWNVQAGAKLAELHTGWLPGVELGQARVGLSSDGGKIVVTSEGVLRSWELPTGRQLWTSREGRAPMVIAFGSGLGWFVTRQPKPWDARRLELLDADSGQVKKSRSVPDFELLAVDPPRLRALIRRQNAVSLWAADGGHADLPQRIRAPGECTDHYLDVRQAGFADDGSLIATWTNEEVVLWDASSLEPILKRGPGHRGEVRASLSPDGTRALSSSTDRSVRTWDLSSGRETAMHCTEDYSPTALFSPDGARSLFTDGRTLRVRDARTERDLWSRADLEQHSAIEFSPDGRLLAVSRSGGGLAVHEAATGRLLWIRSRPMQNIAVLSFTPDARSLLVGFNEQGRLEQRGARTGQLERVLTRTTSTLEAGAQSTLVLPLEHGIAVVDPDRGLVELRNAPPWSGHVLLMPDGARALVSDGSSGIALCRIRDGTELGRIDLAPMYDAARSLALSADGRRLVVGTMRGRLLGLALDVGALPD